MAKNFNFKMANGFSGTMNNVNEVAQLVKAELLNTSNVVVVNGFRFSIGGAEGAEGYALYVGTNDGNPDPFDRKSYVHKIYHLGKIRRGIDKYVADFLTLNTEYGMYNTPMFVWEDGKMVKYVDNNMEENNMVDMVNNVDMFNGYIMDDVLVKDFYDAVESAEVFANEYGDTFAENEHICGDFDYDYDIRQMWADWCWKNDVMSRDDAYKYYDSNRDMFICEDDLDEIVEGFDGTEDVGDGECLVWVRNPYYVEQEQVENNAPCLDEDEYDDNEWSDRDLLIKNTADTIKDYLGNYMPSYLDKFGDCVITVYWDEFSEDMMENMIEDDNFALQVKSLVYGVDGIEDFLVYDDGVYVTVDYDKMFNKVA